MKRPWLLPFTPLWAAGTAWKNARFDRSPLRMEYLELPVISVGSLSAGGAGKTPFVIALGDALRRAGVGFDVLSRGYGRSIDAHLARRVQPTGTTEEFGDEPLLIARSLGRRVYVGSRRAEAGRMAEREHGFLREGNGPWVHLLDDGFQHRRLARNVDIVLLTEADVEDALLPAGDLREPLRSLRRADVVVVRSEEASALRTAIARFLPSGQSEPSVWEIDRVFRFTEGAPSSAPLAFCGIARPDAFRRSLAEGGVRPAHFLALRDHQRYDGALVRRLRDAAKARGADGFVTTAKDAVKLTPAMREELRPAGPLAVADLAVSFRGEAKAMEELLHRLRESSSAKGNNHRYASLR